MNPLTVPGTLDSLEPIRKHVMASASAAGLAEDAAYRLALAVDELATNSIMHGYQENNLAGDVTVIAETDNAEFRIVIEDTAPAYDPRTRKMPTAEDLAKPLEERDIGGLGVFLALEGIDRFDYEHAGNRNRCILGMKRTVA